MDNYTYDQYLEQWDDHFGNACQGEFWYWNKGRRYTIVLPKMDRVTFQATLEKYDSLALKIDAFQKQPDYGDNPALDRKVDNLLAESFKCELPLFF
jgi:hypothetical protein